MVGMLCRTIYNMCTQKPPHDYSEQLYIRYKTAFTVYVAEKVRLPQTTSTASFEYVAHVAAYPAELRLMLQLPLTLVSAISPGAAGPERPQR